MKNKFKKIIHFKKNKLGYLLVLVPMKYNLVVMTDVDWLLPCPPFCLAWLSHHINSKLIGLQSWLTKYLFDSDLMFSSLKFRFSHRLLWMVAMGVLLSNRNQVGLDDLELIVFTRPYFDCQDEQFLNLSRNDSLFTNKKYVQRI